MGDVSMLGAPYYFNPEAAPFVLDQDGTSFIQDVDQIIRKNEPRKPIRNPIWGAHVKKDTDEFGDRSRKVVLGHGSNALVCKHREHAIKVFYDPSDHPDTDKDRELPALLALRGGAAANNVVELLSIVECPTTGMIGYIMPLYRHSLADEIYAFGGGGATMRGTAIWIKEIATALAYVHSHGIIHADLSPRNIMLDRQGRAILCDFGACQRERIPYVVIENEPVYPDRPCSDLTTFCVESPEMMLGDPNYTNAIDIWALGCILYYIHAGCWFIYVENEEDDPLASLARRMTERRGRITEKEIPRFYSFSRCTWYKTVIGKTPIFAPRRDPIYASVFDHLFDSMLAYDPAKRPTAPQIINSLAKILA